MVSPYVACVSSQKAALEHTANTTAEGLPSTKFVFVVQKRRAERLGTANAYKPLFDKAVFPCYFHTAHLTVTTSSALGV